MWNRKSGFKSWSCYVPALWAQASHLISLNLGFLICNVWEVLYLTCGISERTQEIAQRCFAPLPPGYFLWWMLTERGGAEDPGILSPFSCCSRESTCTRRAPLYTWTWRLVPYFFASLQVCLELIMSFGELTGRTSCPFPSHFHRSRCHKFL